MEPGNLSDDENISTLGDTSIASSDTTSSRASSGGKYGLVHICRTGEHRWHGPLFRVSYSPM